MKYVVIVHFTNDYRLYNNFDYYEDCLDCKQKFMKYKCVLSVLIQEEGE